MYKATSGQQGMVPLQYNSGTPVLSVTDNCLIGRKTFSMGGRSHWGMVLETYPATLASEVMDLREEYATTAILNQYNS